ncbi:hypothetical protein [Haloechinothrix salitolerans]|uniref:Lipoprotein n=1 Tax=Haloechinothrix salitolerans TaxID=926830 RepID=A0ABW2BSG0_9PSEU
MKIAPVACVRGVRLLALCGVAAFALFGCAQVAEPSEPSRRANAPTRGLPIADDAGWQCPEGLADVGSVSPGGTVDLAVGDRATLTDGATIAIECEHVEDTCPPGEQCFVGPITHLKIVLTTPDGQRAAGDFTYHAGSKQHELAGRTVSLLRAADAPGEPKRHRLRVDV